MQKFIKKNQRYIYISLPALAIFFLAGISVSGIVDAEKSRSLIVFSLLIIYPVIFFLMGYLSSQKKENIFLYTLPSYLAFVLVFLLWLNNTASLYFFVYISANILGYAVSNLKIKMEQKKEDTIRKTKFYSGKNKF